MTTYIVQGHVILDVKPHGLVYPTLEITNALGHRCFVWAQDTAYLSYLFKDNKLTVLNAADEIFDEVQQVINSLPLKPNLFNICFMQLRLPRQELKIELLELIKHQCDIVLSHVGSRFCLTDLLFLANITADIKNHYSGLPQVVKIEREAELIISNPPVSNINFDFSKDCVTRSTLFRQISTAIDSQEVDEIKITGLKSIVKANTGSEDFAYTPVMLLEILGNSHRWDSNASVFNGITLDELEDICRTVVYKVSANLSNGLVLNEDNNPLVYGDKMDLNCYHSVKYLKRILLKHPDKTIISRKDNSAVTKIEMGMGKVVFFLENTNEQLFSLNFPEGVKHLKEFLATLQISTQTVGLPLKVNSSELT